MKFVRHESHMTQAGTTGCSTASVLKSWIWDQFFALRHETCHCFCWLHQGWIQAKESISSLRRWIRLLDLDRDIVFWCVCRSLHGNVDFLKDIWWSLFHGEKRPERPEQWPQSLDKHVATWTELFEFDRGTWPWHSPDPVVLLSLYSDLEETWRNTGTCS